MQAIVVSTYATAILLKAGLLLWRRRFTPQLMLQQQWKLLTITLMMAGSNHLLYAALRYELDIRVWYDDALMEGNLLLGASALVLRCDHVPCRDARENRRTLRAPLSTNAARPRCRGNRGLITVMRGTYCRLRVHAHVGQQAPVPVHYAPGQADPALNTGEPIVAV